MAKVKPHAGHFKKGEHHGVPWKPGQSGNPNGRPKKFQAVADAALAKIADGVDGREALFTVLFEKALAGDIRCIEIISAARLAGQFCRRNLRRAIRRATARSHRQVRETDRPQANRVTL